MIKDNGSSSIGMREIVMKFMATGDKTLEARLTTMERAWCARQKLQTVQVQKRASRVIFAKKEEPKEAPSED
jgi:hypothetical protein